jgi:hypothetical protein
VHDRLMEDGMSDADWHGKHLTEDEIVADMLARIKADSKALKRRTGTRRTGSPPARG